MPVGECLIHNHRGRASLHFSAVKEAALADAGADDRQEVRRDHAEQCILTVGFSLCLTFDDVAAGVTLRGQRQVRCVSGSSYSWDCAYFFNHCIKKSLPAGVICIVGWRQVG